MRDDSDVLARVRSDDFIDRALHAGPNLGARFDAGHGRPRAVAQRDLGEILEPFAEWIRTWAVLEQRLMNVRRGPEAEGQADDS